MPINVSELKRQEREVSFEYAGDTINLVYNPRALTPVLEGVIKTAERQETPLGGLAHAVSMLVISWDVLDDNAMPIEPDLDFCMQLPNDFLSAVIVACINDQRAGREDLKNSGDGSARRGATAKSRTGIR